MNMEMKELKKHIDSVGLKKGLPKTKKDIVKYLCSAEENGRCDPEEGKWCKGKFICDVSNKPGVCVSPDQSFNTETFLHNGKKNNRNF